MNNKIFRIIKTKIKIINILQEKHQANKILQIKIKIKNNLKFLEN